MSVPEYKVIQYLKMRLLAWNVNTLLCLSKFLENKTDYIIEKKWKKQTWFIQSVHEH